MKYLLSLFAAALLLSIAEAQSGGWHSDVRFVRLPPRPVMGKVCGKPFKVERATVGKDGVLHLMQGREPYADREITVYTYATGVDTLAGKTFTVWQTISPRQKLPHIALSCRKPGTTDVPNLQIFTHHYALKLHFGSKQGNMLPGSIYVCFPDEEKNWAAGTFRAAVL